MRHGNSRRQFLSDDSGAFVICDHRTFRAWIQAHDCGDHHVSGDTLAGRNSVLRLAKSKQD
jgi:hypothetical protein